jgi:hypothetical protein
MLHAKNMQPPGAPKRPHELSQLIATDTIMSFSAMITCLGLFDVVYGLLKSDRRNTVAAKVVARPEHHRGGDAVLPMKCVACQGKASKALIGEYGRFP